ncbi:MAG: MaoC family dehydratase N-terminal domain-containing protein [Chloroflexi bacterium]|nr:MaoC family dehydratase N-terminal domain-containing protein [Chloroflexota bacterium]
MTQQQTNVTPEMLSHIGRKGKKRVFQVTERDILRYTVSIGDKNPLWRDEAFAAKGPNKGIVAPPFFLTMIPVEEEDIDDMNEAGLGKSMGLRMEVPTPGFGGAMATGRDMDFFEPVRPGDTLTMEEELVEVFEKQGRRGPMIFIYSVRTYTNQHGKVVGLEKTGLIRHK